MRSGNPALKDNTFLDLGSGTLVQSDAGVMTLNGTVNKTAFLLVLTLAGALFTWSQAQAATAAGNPGAVMPYVWGGALGGFVLAMVVSFTSRKKIRPALILAYAAFDGLFIGGISAFFEYMWPGIVVQATLATLSVVGVTLALFASGKVRASKRATKVFMIAMIGYLVFSLINVVMMMFGAFPAGSGGPFGMLSSVHIMGIPLGVIIGVVVVIMAAYSLVLDFDSIQQGVRNGAPRKYGWLSAFGIMVTVVWLYVEILRIRSYFRSN